MKAIPAGCGKPSSIAAARRIGVADRRQLRQIVILKGRALAPLTLLEGSN